MEIEESGSFKALITPFKKQITYAGLGLALATAILLNVSNKKNSKERDFFKISNAFQTWVNNKEDTSFKQVNALLKKHPELFPLYEDKIVQSLVTQSKADAATRTAKHLFARANTPSYFDQFSKSTISITNGELDQAVEEALSLKEEMDKNCFLDIEQSNHMTLYGFNLLRIASLYEMQNKYALEMQTWAEWDAFVAKLESKKIKLSLLSEIRDHDITLTDYISFRKSCLTTKQT